MEMIHHNMFDENCYLTQDHHPILYVDSPYTTTPRLDHSDTQWY